MYGLLNIIWAIATLESSHRPTFEKGRLDIHTTGIQQLDGKQSPFTAGIRPRSNVTLGGDTCAYGPSILVHVELGYGRNGYAGGW